MSDRIRPSDLPYTGSRPSGVGFCKDNNGNLMWDGGDSISAIGGGSGLSPSGDLSGATDRIQLQAYIDAASSAKTSITLKNTGQPFIVDWQLNLKSDVTLILEPGVEITLADKLQSTATLVSGNATITVANTTGLIVDMHVGDAAGNLSAGTPFGAIQHDTKILSITGNQVVLTKAPTASGSVTLDFYRRTNVIDVADANNWSIVCPNGWATIDGNMSASYPYADGAHDEARNCIHISNADDFYIDGIVTQNAFHHGIIGVRNLDRPRIGRLRSINNGFRGIHFHGQTTLGISDTYNDVLADDIYVSGNGRKAFFTRQGSQYNSGCYLVYMGAKNLVIDKLTAVNEWGIGGNFSGSDATYAALGRQSKNIHVNTLIAEGCGIGIYLGEGVRNVKFGAVDIYGSHALIPACATTDATDTDRYYVDSNGTVRTVKTRKITLPVGAIAQYGFRPGYLVFGTQSTLIDGFGVLVWSTSIGTGSGGKDVIEVFNWNSETSSPYTGVIGSFDLQYYQSAFFGIYKTTANATYGAIKDITFGSVSIDGIGRYAINSDTSATEYRYTNIHYNSLSIKDIGVNWANGGAYKDLQIDKLYLENIGVLKIDATAGTNANTFNALLNNCVNFRFLSVTRNHSALWTQDAEVLRMDNKCRNGIVNFTAISPVTAASQPIARFDTTAGAGDNGNGFTGPIVVNNPRTTAGGLIAMATSATTNAITRVDATAVIRTTVVDA